MAGVRTALLILLLLAAAPAGFTVQVASTSSRPEAERLVAVLVGRDLQAFWSEATVSGKPVYRVRVGSFATREEAQAFAATLPDDLHLQYWVAPADEAKPAPAASPVPAASPAGGDVIAKAIAAHGGKSGGSVLLEKAKTLVLRYRLKSVDPKSGDPMFTRQIWIRRGADRRLEISPLEDEGPSPSTTVLAGGDAWVTTGGKTAPIPVATASAKVEGLGPNGILRLPLSFPVTGIAAAGLKGELSSAGPRTLNGLAVTRLDALHPPSPYREASLYFDPPTSRLVAARYLTDAGELLLTFDDYREIAPSLVVPFKRTVYRDGTVVSEVEVEALELDTPLDDTLFRKDPMAHDKPDMVVVFKKGTADDAAEATLKKLGYPFREGSDSSHGKVYFYANGPQFLVTVPPAEQDAFAKRCKKEKTIVETWKANWDVQKD